jgi:hypothetical protein
VKLSLRFESKATACEVWASAHADYNEAKSRLEVKLDSFLRRSSDNEHLPASWLPGTETVSERIDLEEVSPAAKEIFENWVKRVRRAVRGYQKVCVRVMDLREKENDQEAEQGDEQR